MAEFQKKNIAEIYGVAKNSTSTWLKDKEKSLRHTNRGK